MALAIVQHSNAIHTTQNPPTAVTLAGAPTAGNLLIALMGVNMASYTVNTAGWTQFDASVTSGAQGQANSNLLAFYRYAQAGDTATLPAFLTAGSTYWSHQIWEISGVTGSWNTDFLCSFPLPLTESNASICPLRVYADSLALTGCASYNGAANATISGSWTLDDANHNNANFGSAAGAHRAMVNGNALDGAWSQGTSSPYSAIVLILTTAQPTNGVYPRHVYRCSGTTGFTSTLALPFDPKIGNLLLAYIPYGAAPTPSPTVAAGWTEYSSVSNGSGKRFLSLYRYSLSGDKTLPALFSAAGQAQEFMLVEMGGSVSGTFATDHVSNKTGEQDTGTTLTTTADTTTANNQFGVLAYGNFNATVDPTATSFDGYLCKSHDTGYGSFLLMFKYLATSGSTVQSTITPGLTSNVQTYSQDIFNFGAGASTETGTGTLAFSGLGFSASGADRHTGTGKLAFSGIGISAAGSRIHVKGAGTLAFAGLGIVAAGALIHVKGTGVLSFSGAKFPSAGSVIHVKGTAVLAFGGLKLVVSGSDVTGPSPPAPPAPPTIMRKHVDPLTWNVPIVGKSGAPTQEFMRKFDKQGSINSTVVPQNYIDAQDAAQLAAGQGYTVSYGATVLVAAKAYTDAQPPNALPSYTVATLPAGQAKGKQAIVTDALTPAYLAPVVGGGAVTAPVFYDGTQWVCH